MTELQVNAHFWVLCGWIPLVQGHVSINPFIRQIYSLHQKHAFVVVCLVTQGYQKGFGGKSGSMEFSLELEESITWAGHHVTVQFHSTWARTGEGTIGVGTAITTRTVATLINIWKGKHEVIGIILPNIISSLELDWSRPSATFPLLYLLSLPS